MSINISLLQKKERYILNKRHKKYYWLILYCISFVICAFVILYIPPTITLKTNQTIPMWPIFLTFLFLTFFSLGTYLFKNKTHGVLIGAFIVVYLFLRLSHLTHPFFLILLIGLLLTLELMVSYRK